MQKRKEFTEYTIYQLICALLAFKVLTLTAEMLHDNYSQIDIYKNVSVCHKFGKLHGQH